MEKLFSESLLFWKDLNVEEKDSLMFNSILVQRKKGEIIHQTADACTGLEVVKTGRLRVFITSPNGNEITLFRLLGGDVSLLSATCMIKNLNVETSVEYEQDTDAYILPKNIYTKLNDKNMAVKEYTLNLVAEMLSEIMWLFSQYVFSNSAHRLAQSLIEHNSLSDENTFKITHEALAKDLGTAREVITRLLKQFQVEELIIMKRGEIEITNIIKLSRI